MKNLDWVLVIIAICCLWLGLMVGMSYLSYEDKLPVRIENWKPQPPPPP